MAISGVDPKCYILALFVRDDGVRFLLGDDPFEFKDKQLHFQPNTVANDVVEVQGNDGYLLAGQVRRPGTQMFDGYVCNGTNSKEEVEVQRRAFLQFFRRSHFYKVIYVFPNGTAMQRKQGFLVDDPTVQELYQQYPEYHVALNFEDVNYYTYEEDDEGHEIYAKEAIIKLAGGGATGGLIWDNYGVVWENPWSDIVTVSGVDFQVDNLLPVRVPIEGTQLKGDTYQQTYSGYQLLPTPYASGDSRTHRGITYEVNPDGTITMNGQNDGTASSVYFFVDRYGTMPLFELEAGNYYFIPNDQDVRYEMYDGSSYYTFTASNNYTVTFQNNVSIRQIYAMVLRTNTTTFTNYKLYPMLTKLQSPTTADYEPYTGGIPAPNPDYPQDIQTVTGAQTVSITDGTNTQNFTVDLGSIELCKIGTYQDYIYKSGDDWYVHKMLEKYVFDGTEAWKSGAYGTNSWTLDDVIITSFDTTKTQVISNLFRGIPHDDRNIAGDNVIYLGSNIRLWIRNTSLTTLTNVQNATNGNYVYYALATPTDTKITDATLVGQLEALDAMRLFIGENNILVSASSPNLPTTLQFDYYTQYLEPHGAEWEEGGTKGATIVNVDAIDNTYPVWELTGPAINPTLSVLTTNTTLTYNGTITASQKLVIDMFNKTATLNGTSVIGNVTGDFVYMAPGTNRVAYTAGNADAPDSKISWQEVVG